MRKSLLTIAAVTTLLAGAACTVSQQSAPSPSGPSEFALSLRMRATPDHLVADGSQSSRVEVTAFDSAGKPIAVNVHVDAFASVGGASQNFGTLSATTIVTGTDASRPTFVTFTPPVSTSSSTNVTIFGSIIASDSSATNAQQVAIVVSPASAVVASAPTATIALIPSLTTYNVGQAITFDGGASCGSQLVAGACPGTITTTSLLWNFGDGNGVVGNVVLHAYAAAGTYTATLFVTNTLGITTSATRTVVVAAVDKPTASFNISPTTIKVSGGGNAFFNAAASAAAAGHTIIRYDWNFGDSNTGQSTSPTITHAYGAANVYHTTLTVTDDLGQTATAAVDATITP